MTSDDIVMVLSGQSQLISDMSKSVLNGGTLWFVDAESGDAQVAVFMDTGILPPGTVIANDALHALLGVPAGKLWISPAANVQVNRSQND